MSTLDSLSNNADFGEQFFSAGFRHTANTDFNAETEKKITCALASLRLYFSREHVLSLMIGGEEQFSASSFWARNPSNTSETLMNVSAATEPEIKRAIECVLTSREVKAWSADTIDRRRRKLDDVADLLEKNRFRFIALMMLEVGKDADGADKEISEAIDMLRFYGAAAALYERICMHTNRSPSGERNVIVHGPLETPPLALVVAPWNFPVAISVGPIAAALVMGWSVLYKPAEESSLIGRHLTKLFHEAGIPTTVLQCLPGDGETTGKMLVEHPAVKLIAFTGSAAVAREIEYAVAGWNYNVLPNSLPRESFRKRIAAMETGGNNAIIIDSSADMEEALGVITRSAYGYAGQKCSACQRLIIVDDKQGFYATVTNKLARALGEINVGPPDDLNNFYGPVITQAAFDRIRMVIDQAQKSGATIRHGTIAASTHAANGYFIVPTLIEGLPNYHPLVSQEIFGPVLFVLRANSVEEAVGLANATQYGLTGGLCSRDEGHKKYVRDHLIVGNYYENKPTTGAVVARQPFGGTKMSGVGYPAGGFGYLANFARTRTLSINTMRQGAVLE